MAEYQYQGVDKTGKRVTGTLVAPTEGDLRVMLRGMGVRPVKIKKPSLLEADLGTLIRGSAPTMQPEALVTFTRQLNVLISSGIPLIQSLEVLADQALDKTSKSIIHAVREKVAAGSFLWEAMAGYPNAFPKIYVALIRAGEAAGAMDQVLKRLSRYLEDADRLRKMVKGAMMYPAIVLVVGAGVIALMLIFVIPKFEELLKSSGQQLPWFTQVVIDSSHFLVNNILAILAGGFIVIYLLIKYFKSPEGRALRDRVLFRAPLFGNLMQKAGVARFSRTMQTLLSSGVNLIDAVDICRATVDNVVLEQSIAKIRAEVESGKTLGATLSRLPEFPKMAVQMISVGENTGSLDRMLEKVADFYETEVEALVGGMTKMIEPLVLVFLGGTVGALMIAMYLPIFQLAGGAGQ